MSDTRQVHDEPSHVRPGAEVTVTDPAWARLLDVVALVGLGFVAFQAWGIVAWLFSDGFAEVSSGDDVPAAHKWVILIEYPLMWAIAAAWLVVVVKDLRRRRVLTWTLLVSLAWLLTMWAENLANVTGPRFAWNGALLDRGDWTDYLPFVDMAADGLPMPLLVEPLVFFGFLSILGFAAAWFMRLLRDKGITNGWALAGLAWLAMMALEFAFEMGGIYQESHAYPLAYGPLTIFDGTRMQFPLYENWLLSLMWVLPGWAIYFLRDARGGKDVPPPRWRPGRLGATATVLAAAGALNLAFVLYNLIAFVWLPGDTVADLPPWLTP